MKRKAKYSWFTRCAGVTLAGLTLLGLGTLTARAEIPFFPGQLNQMSDNSGETQHVDVNGDGFLGPGDTLRGTLKIETLEDQSGGGGTITLGTGGIEELSAVFEIEVIGFEVVSDTNGSCGSLLSDPTCNGGNSLSGDEFAIYQFGPHHDFWYYGPDGANGSGDELEEGTMVAFYQDSSPDYNRVLPSVAAIEATATDPFGPAVLEMGFGTSVVTGLEDGDHRWTAGPAPVDTSYARTVPAGTAAGYFNVQLSILAERFPSFSFQQVPAGAFPALDDGLIDVNGQGGILGTKGIATAYDVYDNVDLAVRVAGPEPAIDIEKFTNGVQADDPTGPQVQVGCPVEWTYVVTNIGELPLSGVAVGDDQGVAVTCPQTTLAVGESMTCTGTPGIAQAGQYANIGDVVGTSPTGVQVTDEDPSHYLGAQMAAVDIEKSTNGFDADTGTGPEIPVGGPVTWEYVVANTGSVTLINLMVTDNQLGQICTIASLQPGGSATCTVQGVAAAGQYENVGTVVGTNEAECARASDSDPSHYYGQTEGEGEGCTPGYWKQPHHFDSWTNPPYAPTTLFSDVFEDAFPGMTLVEVLAQGGGGLNALGRHIVAALLNAASGGVDYDETVANIIAEFNAVYPGSKPAYTALKNKYAGLNELGCPLD